MCLEDTYACMLPVLVLAGYVNTFTSEACEQRCTQHFMSQHTPQRTLPAFLATRRVFPPHACTCPILNAAF